MGWKNDSRHWGGVAQIFHWAMALIIILLGIVGWVMTSLPNTPYKIKIYTLHKSLGLTILALALLRLVWRSYDTRPSELLMPPWQAVAARSVHVLLYILMFAIPLSGWLFNSAAGFPLAWFGLLPVPSLTGGASPELKIFARAAHYYLFWVLLAAFLAHVGAALKHHFVDRDATLQRMLPWHKRMANPVTPARPALDPVATQSSKT